MAEYRFLYLVHCFFNLFDLSFKEEMEFIFLTLAAMIGDDVPFTFDFLHQQRKMSLQISDASC